MDFSRLILDESSTSSNLLYPEYVTLVADCSEQPRIRDVKNADAQSVATASMIRFCV